MTCFSRMLTAFAIEQSVSESGAMSHSERFFFKVLFFSANIISYI